PGGGGEPDAPPPARSENPAAPRRRRAVRGRRPGAPHRDPPPPPRRPRAPRLHEPGDRLRAPRALRARPAALRLPADDLLAAPRGDPARLPDDGEDDPGRLRAVRGGVRARPGDTPAAGGDRAAGASVEPRLRRAESGESGALAGSHRGAERALSRLSTFLRNRRHRREERESSFCSIPPT